MEIPKQYRLKKQNFACPAINYFATLHPIPKTRHAQIVTFTPCLPAF